MNPFKTHPCYKNDPWSYTYLTRLTMGILQCLFFSVKKKKKKNENKCKTLFSVCFLPFLQVTLRCLQNLSFFGKMKWKEND